MVAINAKKKKFALLRGAFAEKPVTEFVGGLVSVVEVYPGPCVCLVAQYQLPSCPIITDLSSLVVGSLHSL
jgi:hypothetical protein